MRLPDWRFVRHMKWMSQFLIIIMISFLGETLRHLIPLTVPSGIYGLVILFVLLLTGAVRLSWVEEAADFIVEIKPLFFIPAGVGLMTQWKEMETMFLPFVLSVIVITTLVMAATGWVTQALMHRRKELPSE